MTNDELKAALFSGCPVKYQDKLHTDGIICKCVSAIIYKNQNGKLAVLAELTDRNSNAVYIVEPSRVTEVNI